MRRHVREGARTLDDLARLCRAGSDCGGCHDRLLRLIEEETAPDGAERTI